MGSNGMSCEGELSSEGSEEGRMSRLLYMKCDAVY